MYGHSVIRAFAVAVALAAAPIAAHAAAGLGAVFLGEELTAHQITGALIIGSGLLIIDGRLLRWGPPARSS